MADPQLPLFLQWIPSKRLRPSFLTSDLCLSGIQISGFIDHLSEQLGVSVNDSLDGIHLDLIASSGHPGITQVTFESPTRGIIVV